MPGGRAGDAEQLQGAETGRVLVGRSEVGVMMTPPVCDDAASVIARTLTVRDPVEVHCSEGRSPVGRSRRLGSGLATAAR